MKEYVEKGLSAFQASIKDCKDEEEVKKVSALICTQCIMILRGIEGQKFVKDFLRSAIKDTHLKIEPKKVH